MNQFKKAQVIMLPTEDITLFYKWGDRLYHNCLKRSHVNTKSDSQHLYITSDDKIEKNDWYIYLKYNTIIQKKDSLPLKNNCKKIITTTNTSLNNCAVMYCSEKCIDYCVYKNDLPQPSQQFIEKYIESYNKGEVITDVLVEYEYVDCLYSVEKTTHKRILKVNDKDNTINIKSIKDSWNREEVIEKMWLSYKASNTIFEDEIALKMEFNNWLTL